MTTWTHELAPVDPTGANADVGSISGRFGSVAGALRAGAPMITVLLATACLVAVRPERDDVATSAFSGRVAAEVLPLLALAGMAIAMGRHRPNLDRDPIRPVARHLALASCLAAFGLIAVRLTASDAVAHLVGPAISIAVLGSYVASWGLRSPALMRTVGLLSLLTWNTIATRVDSIVGNTLARPSDMVYRRLAQVPALGIDHEPWRLYTATMHRGSLIVIATVVLTVAITRQRFTPKLVINVALTAGASLVVHHVIVLASPIDEYQPGELAQTTGHPLFELMIATIGVLVLVAVTGGQRARPTTNGAARHVDGRDPYIFGLSELEVPRGVAAMLYSGTGALALLLVFAGV